MWQSCNLTINSVLVMQNKFIKRSLKNLCSNRKRRIDPRNKNWGLSKKVSSISNFECNFVYVYELSMLVVPLRIKCLVMCNWYKCFDKCFVCTQASMKIDFSKLCFESLNAHGFEIDVYLIWYGLLIRECAFVLEMKWLFWKLNVWR